MKKACLPNLIQINTSKPSAFTLLELILVLLVLTIIAGFSAVNFKQTFDRYQLFKIVDDLAYHMRYAQSRAIAQNKILRLEFDASFQSYGLSQSSAPAKEGTEGSSFLPINGALGETVRVPDEFKLNTETSRMDFYPDGNIDRGEIVMCRDQRCFTLSTRQQRGVVKIFEYSRRIN